MIQMNVSLYQAAAAMNATARWQEMITENISSSMMPGFKKNEVSFSAIQAGLMSANSTDGTVGVGLMPQSKILTNFRQGQTRYTGVKTDFAIDSPGFFEVQIPAGGVAYTRDGEFHLDTSGRLVTKSGFYVLSNNGLVQFDPKNVDAISITPEGEISQGSEAKGKLRVVDFNDTSLLKSIGGCYFLADNPKIKSAVVNNPSLKQGCLEESNSTPLFEMGNMLLAMRFYEANQRLIQMQDERMAKAINELGGT